MCFSIIHNPYIHHTYINITSINNAFVQITFIYNTRICIYKTDDPGNLYSRRFYTLSAIEGLEHQSHPIQDDVEAEEEIGLFIIALFHKKGGGFREIGVKIRGEGV